MRVSVMSGSMMQEMDVGCDLFEDMEGATVLRCRVCGLPRSFMDLMKCDCGNDMMTWVPSGCLMVMEGRI